MSSGLDRSRSPERPGVQHSEPMRLALIFNKTRPDTTGVYFERACRKLQVDYDHWWLKDVHRMPASYDLYLRIDHGDDYLVELPRRLRPAVFYALDTHLAHCWRKIRRVAPQYQLVFCALVQAASQLKNGEWLPFACDEELHGPCRESPVWDVAFVGTDGDIPRKFYLQALRERYPNSFIGLADHTALGSIYSRARIGFNYSITHDVNMRVFEILAAGILLVTNALRGEDPRSLGLEAGRHFVEFRRPEELFSLMDYYLVHPEERQGMARAGAAVVWERHTYAHRLRQLLTVASERLGLPDVPS